MKIVVTQEWIDDHDYIRQWMESFVTPKRTLHMTVGLPRSGKSTWAKTEGLPVVNPDSIRLAIYGQAFIPDAERLVWATAHYMAKALFLAGHTDVILDATNVTAARRAEWETLMEKLEGQTQLHVFPTHPDVCKERAVATDQAYLLPIIDQMAADWDLGRPADWPELVEA